MTSQQNIPAGPNSVFKIPVAGERAEGNAARLVEILTERADRAAETGDTGTCFTLAASRDYYQSLVEANERSSLPALASPEHG